MVLDSTVVFSELMYNPPNDQDLEWIELHNEMAVDMDISQWQIDGVDYTFPAGTVMPAGGYLVVAKSPSAFTAATGLANPLGPFAGRMDNRGETLRLINNSQRTMDEVDYSDRDPWPVGPDGSGATLAKINPDGGSRVCGQLDHQSASGGHAGLGELSPRSSTGSHGAPDRAPQAWHYDDRGIDLGTDWRAIDFDPDDPNGDGNPADAWKTGERLVGQRHGGLSADRLPPRLIWAPTPIISAPISNSTATPR